MAPAGAPAKPGRPLLRRVTVIGLVVLSLALLSVYFRESSSGTLHGVQDAGATVIYPFQVAAERVGATVRGCRRLGRETFSARNRRTRSCAPRSSACGSSSSRARQPCCRTPSSAGCSASGKGRRSPATYNGVAARIIGRTPGQFEQQVLIAAGSNARVHVNDPVVTAAGLVGRVARVSRRSARVTLLTDETSAVSALDLKTNAAGIVRHGVAGGEALVLERVRKEDVVEAGDVVITAGWRSGRLASIYPRGIPIGLVTSVGQLDTDIYKRIEVNPFVDFSSLDSVLVLVEKPATPRRASRR